MACHSSKSVGSWHLHSHTFLFVLVISRHFNFDPEPFKVYQYAGLAAHKQWVPDWRHIRTCVKDMFQYQEQSYSSSSPTTTRVSQSSNNRIKTMFGCISLHFMPEAVYVLTFSCFVQHCTTRTGLSVQLLLNVAELLVGHSQ